MAKEERKGQNLCLPFSLRGEMREAQFLWEGLKGPQCAFWCVGSCLALEGLVF